MTDETIVAGITPTAPCAVTDPAAKTPKSVSKKVMLLAVHQDQAGEIMITPIDVEHEVDDQSDLSPYDKAIRIISQNEYHANAGAIKKGLGALFTVFDQRLYRESFRNFENFCFALYGTHRIAEAVVTKAKAKAKKLQAELEIAV